MVELTGSPAQGSALLPPDSYTLNRLKHATPEHLHLTTRRCFIGPIPEGWLKSHRRDWYKRHLHLGDSSRHSTFQEDPVQKRRRQLTGLEGPSSGAWYGSGFSQPDDLELEEEDEDEDEGGNNDQPRHKSAPSAIPIPGSTPADGYVVSKGVTRLGGETSLESGDPSARGGDTVVSPRSGKSLKPSMRRSDTTSSYVTASEGSSGRSSLEEQPTTETTLDQQKNGKLKQPKLQVDPANTAAPQALDYESTPGGRSASFKSTTPLLPKDTAGPSDKPDAEVGRSLTMMEPASVVEGEEPLAGNFTSRRSRRQSVRNLVRFDIPEDSKRAEIHKKARQAQSTLRRAPSSFRRRHTADGRIVRMEKMLVRVETTAQELPADFGENEGLRIESRIVEKWREYMVVCRESSAEDQEAEFVIQMYKTRVIPEIEEPRKQKKWKHQVPLARKTARVNLYSTLDKSLVLWTPYKQGTMFYTMQPRSAANSVEWYTFIGTILGRRRTKELQINIPDLNANLQLTNPFEELEIDQDPDREDADEDETIRKTMEMEQAVAGKLINQALGTLENNPKWGDLLEQWSKNERMGLAWKRYDRLEWIHGANERKMYGILGMLKSHDLELRPKEHYPTSTHDRSKNTLEEPPAVEGFLIRLTTLRGKERKVGKLFFKRLYFSSHDQFLIFSRPAKCTPPPPPQLLMSEESRLPTAKDIADQMPLIYAIDPYPLQDGEIPWLTSSSQSASETARVHDKHAYAESERKMKLLVECDGYINMCNIVRVRKVVMGAGSTDEEIGDGSDVDFDADFPDTEQDDGATATIDENRTFEIILRNGLVIRLQAYDAATRKEWIIRLRKLARYWRYRILADAALFQSVRQTNLTALKITEEEESHVGQFAKKWEVSASFASPTLHHVCGIACCRTVRMSGVLFRKPRLHATFTRSSVILVAGKLLVFQDTVRSWNGNEVAHIHHEKMSSIDLSDCFLYSGLLTESDLLYRNRTFDANNPGHHGLPRVYREDGWTSTDEDMMTCFVLWHGKKRSFFRSAGNDGFESQSEGRRAGVRLVTKLGVPGNRVVFRARSRAERDLWVLAIQAELERLGSGEEVRLTEGKSGTKQESV